MLVQRQHRIGAVPAARPPSAACPAARGPAGRAPSLRCAAQPQQQQQQQRQRQRPPPTAEELGRQAQEFARRTSRQVSDFVREQELDKKAAAAYEDASQSLRTTYERLDAEWGLRRRVSSLQGRLSETAQDIDQSLRLRRRVRNAFEDARRMAPMWRRRAAEYGATPQGKAAYTLLFVGLLVSGALFKLLNLVWLAWWVGAPLSLFLAHQQRRRQQEGAAARRAGWGGGGGGTATGGGSGAGAWDRAGPVVEAEWVSIDDEGRPICK